MPFSPALIRNHPVPGTSDLQPTPLPSRSSGTGSPSEGDFNTVFSIKKYPTALHSFEIQSCDFAINEFSTGINKNHPGLATPPCKGGELNPAFPIKNLSPAFTKKKSSHRSVFSVFPLCTQC